MHKDGSTLNVRGMWKTLCEIQEKKAKAFFGASAFELRGGVWTDLKIEPLSLHSNL